MSSAPHKTLRHKLTQLREQLDQRQQQRRQARMDKLKLARTQDEVLVAHGLDQHTVNAEVATFFEAVLKQVGLDQRRLGQEVLPTRPLVGGGALMTWMVERLQGAEALLPAPAPLDSQLKQLGVNPAVLAFMQAELEALLHSQTARSATPAPLLQKFKQATAAYGEGRTTDTLTILKNALNSDPHNQTLLACLSQILYGLALGGTPTALPEARDSAQRSTIAGEHQRPPRLLLYRYLAAVTERNFSEERSMAWLRESELLNLEPLLNPRKGLLAEHGMYLKAWALAATVNPACWHEQDFRALRQLVEEVIGGASVYLCWFRKPLLQFAAQSKTPPPELDAIEELIAAALQEYQGIHAGLTKLPVGTSARPWIIRVRWLNTLASVMPMPSFEHVLCHVALSGDVWQEQVFPDRELRLLLDDHGLSTWQIWAQSITPHKDLRKPYLLPAEETVQDADLLEQTDHLLSLLQEAEKERIDAELWPDLKPWLVRWRMDHLLAAATGSSQPRNRYSPSLMPYSSFYRIWQDPIVSGLVASELIQETAQRGGFASLFEVIATFEGALRLLDDATHGLVATQRRALLAARKQNPAKYANVKPSFMRTPGATVGLAAVPLGVLGAWVGAMMLADNLSQMVGFTLALLGLAGVVVLNLTKS